MTDTPAADTVERVRNPHRPAPRAPLLTPHDMRPATLASGVAMVGMGAVLFAHQVGWIAMGPGRTVALLVVAAACAMAGLAVSWARRASGAPTET